MLRPRASAQTIHEDLLYIIFLSAGPSEFKAWDYNLNCPVFDFRSVEPMNFSLVCRSWRATVLSHPSLWSNIRIKDNVPMRDSLHYFLSKWLQNSKASLLSIELQTWRIRANDEEEISIRDLIDTTLAQHFRLKDIDIYSAIRPTERPFTLPFSPTLESVSLSLKHFRVPSTFAASLDFASCADGTKLRKMFVSNGVQWILPKHPCHTLHFPNLSTVDICTDLTGRFDDFYSVLAAIRCVVDLSIRARRCVHSCPTPTSAHISSVNDPVLLSRLTNLSVACENRSAALQLLRSLTCPSLRDLDVFVPEFSKESNNLEDNCITSSLLTAYVEFFTRSQAPLSSLMLAYPSESIPSSHSGRGRALKMMLRPLHTLEVLSLHNVGVDNELIEEMRVGKESTDLVVCPLLTEIRIFDSDTSNFSVQPMVVNNMILSRRRAPEHALKKISLVFPGFQYHDGGV